MPERTNRTGPEFLMVEIRGFEPLTSWMPFKRSPNWAIPPNNKSHYTDEALLCQARFSVRSEICGGDARCLRRGRLLGTRLGAWKSILRLIYLHYFSAAAWGGGVSPFLRRAGEFYMRIYKSRPLFMNDEKMVVIDWHYWYGYTFCRGI